MKRFFLVVGLDVRKLQKDPTTPAAQTSPIFSMHKEADTAYERALKLCRERKTHMFAIFAAGLAVGLRPVAVMPPRGEEDNPSEELFEAVTKVLTESVNYFIDKHIHYAFVNLTVEE